MDGRDDGAKVAAETDEGAPAGAKAIADGNLGVALALGQQVKGQDLRVVEIVDDLGVSGSSR